MLVEGYSFEKLVADKRTYYSVMKNVEVVGEAAYMLTKAFKGGVLSCRDRLGRMGFPPR